MVVLLLLTLPAPAGAAPAGTPADSTLRIGLIGLDTSHSVAFTRRFNDPDAPPALAGLEVVAAYPRGTADIPLGTRRLPRFTEEVRALGVAIVPSLDALLERVDVVLLETHDGRLHLDQALRVFEAGKPVFIDKPFAASLADAVALFDAAARYDVPVFSSSSTRFMENAQAIRAGRIGRVLGADTYSPAPLEPTHPDLFWYGIHGVEALFTVMGTGLRQVTRVTTDSMDVVVGTWDGGRVGTFRGIREGQRGYGGTAFGTDEIAPIGPYGGYEALLTQIADFFRTGVAPVAPEETLEIYAFMAAADASKRRGGTPVRVDAVLAEARRQAADALNGPARAEAQVMQVLAALWDALARRDRAAFDRHLADGWVLHTARGPLTADALFDLHTRHLTDFAATLSAIEARVEDGTARVTFNAHLTGRRDGADWGGDFAFTGLFRRQPDGWQSVFLHEQRLPP